MYVADAQIAGPFATLTKTLVVNAAGDPSALAGPIRVIVGRLDATAPLTRVATMGAIAGRHTAAPRFRARLLGGFAVVALLLSLVGLYGTLSYAVSRRTREMGIRLALGARRGDVVGLVVRQGMAVVAVGLALGLAAALAASRLVAGLLFEVAPTDPAVYAAVTAVLALAGLAACLVPARRASRVDPATALRVE